MASELAQLLAHSTVFELPLASRFRGVTSREGVLIRGPSGWGEFAPFSGYDDQTSARWLACAIEAAYGTWPEQRRSWVPVNAIVPALDPQAAAALAYRAATGDGCNTIKIKVAEAGQTLDDDIARVAAVRSALDSAGIDDPRIRVDANGAWSVAEAAVAIREIDQVAGCLEYVEQPCATLVELAQLRRRSPVPIAADESIRNAGDPIVAARSGAIDIIVVKVAPLGGVGLALAVAEAAAVPIVVSGAMDTAVGLSAGVALAAAVDSLPYACGLGTGALLATDVVRNPLRPRRGRLQAHRREPDRESLGRAADGVTTERVNWWHARLERAWNAGGAELAGAWVRGSKS